MAAGLVARSQVQAGAPYNQYKGNLRYDFVYSCAYCSVVEIEAHGFGFEIDHHQPTAHGGTDSYDNLYWSCEFCNRRKSDFWPSPAALQAGRRLLRVDRDDADAHIVLDERDHTKVRPASTVGDTTIRALELNRHHFKRIREIRKRRLVSSDAIANGIRRLATARTDQLPRDLRTAVEELRAEIYRTENAIYDSVRALAVKLSKSEALDPDPDEAAHTAARRLFLQSSGALPKKPRRRTGT